MRRTALIPAALVILSLLGITVTFLNAGGLSNRAPGGLPASRQAAEWASPPLVRDEPGPRLRGLEQPPGPRLASDRALHVRVVNQAGVAVPHAEVAFSGAFSIEGGRAFGWTDSAGALTLSLPSEVSAGTLAASAPGVGSRLMHGVRVPGDVRCVLSAGATLTVRVREHPDRPVSGADLLLEVCNGLVRRTGTTDGHGSCQFMGLPFGTEAAVEEGARRGPMPHLTVRQGGRVVAQDVGPLLSDPEQVAWNVDLGKQVRIRVAAHDDRGAPVAGARVRVVSGIGSKEVVARAETDARGRATLGPVYATDACWPFHVEVEANGYAPAWCRLEDNGGGAVLWAEAKLTRAVRLRGRVLDLTGRGASGVRVALDESGFNWALAVRSGDGGAFDGLYVPERWLSKTRTVTLQAEALGVATSTEVTLPPAAGVVDAEVVWPPAEATRIAHGTVTLPDGRPASGAWIRFVCREGNVQGAIPRGESHMAPDSGRALADARGAYRIRIPAASGSQSWVVASLPGFAAAASCLPCQSNAIRRNLRLGAARSLAGRVVCAGGFPVRGARVAALPLSSSDEESATNQRTAGPDEWPADEPKGPDMSGSWTDQNGCFTLVDVPADCAFVVSALLSRRSYNGRDRWRAWRIVSPQVREAELHLTCDDSALFRASPRRDEVPDEVLVRVRALDADNGESGERRGTYVLSGNETRRVISGSWAGDEVTLWAPPGAGELELTCEDGRRVAVPVCVPSGANIHTVDVRLDAAAVRVWLRIPPPLTEDDVALHLARRHHEPETRALRVSGDGSRVAPYVEPGRWRLVATVLGDDGWAVEHPCEIEVMPSKGLALTVPLVRTVPVVVESKWKGRPGNDPRARVEVDWREPEWAVVVRDEGGRTCTWCELREEWTDAGPGPPAATLQLPPGRYWFELQVRGRPAATASAAVGPDPGGMVVRIPSR